jgi:4-hydroxy-tetrahydrodipicolinate reductase
MKCALFGSLGRMGSLIRQAAGSHLDVVMEYDSHPPALTADVPLQPDIDVVIDFSAPSAWSDLDNLLEPSAAALVTGTTGLGTAEESLLGKWASSRPVFRASNFSRGVYVMERLLAEASRLLGDDFVAEMVEVHHGGKEDSPSGTALNLLEVWQRNHPGRLIHGREGRTGPRDASETGVHSIRGGDVVGEHEVHLLGRGERLLIAHRASSRLTFAAGAVRAALWLAGREPGLYGMDEMMGGESG